MSARVTTQSLLHEAAERNGWQYEAFLNTEIPISLGSAKRYDYNGDLLEKVKEAKEAGKTLRQTYTNFHGTTYWVCETGTTVRVWREDADGDVGEAFEVDIVGGKVIQAGKKRSTYWNKTKEVDRYGEGQSFAKGRFYEDISVTKIVKFLDSNNDEALKQRLIDTAQRDLKYAEDRLAEEQKRLNTMILGNAMQVQLAQDTLRKVMDDATAVEGVAALVDAGVVAVYSKAQVEAVERTVVARRAEVGEKKAALEALL